jgi:chromosome segregation ATPase
MNRLVRKEFILAVGGCLIVMLIAGCEQQNIPTEKKNRLIAYENKPLKEQLAQQDKKIEEQDRLLKECQQKREVLEKVFEKEQQQEKKIEEQDKLLKECQQRRDVLENRFNEELNGIIKEVTEVFSQSDEQMRQENDRLKAQVEELKAKVSNLEQQLKKCESAAGPRPLTQ